MFYNEALLSEVVKKRYSQNSTLCIYVTLTVDFGEVAECPDCPVLDLRRISTTQQTQNRLK